MGENNGILNQQYSEQFDPILPDMYISIYTSRAYNWTEINNTYMNIQK